MATLRIIVRGEVHGVGFRAYAQEFAEEMGIVGEVWNRRDGAVEIVAEHSDTKVLDAYAQAMEEGPGQVSEVESRVGPEGGYVAFEISPTR